MGQTIIKPTALGPVANTDTKFLIYGLFQKGRVLAQDGVKRREKAKSSLFRQFYQSLQAAQLDFELADFKIIRQSSPATKSSMAILSYTAAIAKSWTQAGKATDDGRRRPAPGVRLTIGGLS